MLFSLGCLWHICNNCSKQWHEWVANIIICGVIKQWDDFSLLLKNIYSSIFIRPFLMRNLLYPMLFPIFIRAFGIAFSSSSNMVFTFTDLGVLGSLGLSDWFLLHDWVFSVTLFAVTTLSTQLVRPNKQFFILERCLCDGHNLVKIYQFQNGLCGHTSQASILIGTHQMNIRYHQQLD